MELCVETLGEIMSLLSREDVGPVESDLGDLAIRLLPTVLKTASSMVMEETNTDEALVVSIFDYFFVWKVQKIRRTR